VREEKKKKKGSKSKQKDNTQKHNKQQWGSALVVKGELGILRVGTNHQILF
jgi:hypothetical protein